MFANGDKICIVGKIKGKSGAHWGNLQNFDGKNGEVKLDKLGRNWPLNNMIIPVTYQPP